MGIFPDTKLGFGLMRLPQNDPANPADVNVEMLKDMVDVFMEAGFTYFDTAIMYNNFASQKVIKEALVDRYPRDSFTLATKLHHGFINTKEDRDKIFEDQLQKTGAGFFDYYLIHGVEGGNLQKYEDLDCFAWLANKREEGLVRHMGLSFHDTAEILDDILTRYPDLEFVQLQVNYLDWESEWIQSRACYEVATAHGKPVVVMEPVKGGTLAAIPPEAQDVFAQLDPNASPASWAIRFAASLPNVGMVLSGMSDIAQMRDNVATMRDFEPLDEAEQAACFKAADVINAQVAIPCTGCAYCAPGCPMNIAIPQYFSLYNEVKREDMEHKGWTASFAVYREMTRTFGAADECVECGQCESVCPQHLPIIELLKDVAVGLKMKEPKH